MSADHFMPLYIGDFLADTAHLSTEEKGAYILLLMSMWKNGGALPNDPRKLARISGFSLRKFPHVWASISSFFTEEDGHISQGRLVREYELSQRKHALRVAAGAKGGRAKSLKYKDAPPSNAKAMLKQPQPQPLRKRVEAKASPLDQNGFDLDAESPPGGSDQDEVETLPDKPTPQFSAFWPHWPHKVGKAKAQSAFARLSAENRAAAIAAVSGGWFERWQAANPRLNGLHASTFLNGKRWDDEFTEGPQGAVVPFQPRAETYGQEGARKIAAGAAEAAARREAFLRPNGPAGECMPGKWFDTDAALMEIADKTKGQTA